MPTLPPLKDIDLSKPLAGREGHDVNYVSRVRTQYLFAQHQALLAQIQFADAKAAALMTVLGLIVFRGPIAWDADGIPPFLRYLFLFFIAVAVFFAFWSVFPRYPARKIREFMASEERWSWPALAADSLDPGDFASFMQTSEVSELVHSVSRSNVAVARILLRKYTALRFAFIFSCGAMMILCYYVYQGF